MAMPAGVIYGLFEDGIFCRYIGQTTQKFEYRLSQHLSDARTGSQTAIAVWIRSKNYKINACRLELVEDDLDGRERWWIEFMRQFHPLLNMTAGGKGTTEDSIQKLKRLAKERWQSPERRAKYIAARNTPERKETQRQINHARFQDPLARAHMAEATRRRFLNQSERDKVAAVNRKRFEDPAERARMGAILKASQRPKGWKQPEEVRRKISETKKRQAAEKRRCQES